MVPPVPDRPLALREVVVCLGVHRPGHEFAVRGALAEIATFPEVLDRPFLAPVIAA